MLCHFKLRQCLLFAVPLTDEFLTGAKHVFDSRNLISPQSRLRRSQVDSWSLIVTVAS